MLNVAVPEFVTCALLVALFVPTAWLLKGTLAGLRATAGAVPVPESAIVCGLPAASSEMDTFALWLPPKVGANWIPRKQELPVLTMLAPREHAGEPVVGVTNAN